jgi:hypothetical protein
MRRFDEGIEAVNPVSSSTWNELDTRQLAWIGVTKSPWSDWIAGQITAAFPWDCAPVYLIPDRDCAFGSIVRQRPGAVRIRANLLRPTQHSRTGMPND